MSLETSCNLVTPHSQPLSAMASARVLHDRPPPFFRRTPNAEAHDLFLRLADTLPAHQSRYAEARAAAAEASLLETSDGTSAEKTLFTELQRALPGAVPQLRPDRPALLVSSTSWTEDEDFGLLVGALAALDKVAVMEPAAYPDFVVCITGKGPLRAHYEARLAELRLKRVHVRTLWLEAGDYPRLLGAADMGICLHTSSSGLDLPMKVRGFCLHCCPTFKGLVTTLSAACAGRRYVRRLVARSRCALPVPRRARAPR